MKRLTALVMMLPSLTFAHGTVLEAVRDGSVAAINTFKANETKEVQKTFKGIKSWSTGDVINVKLYLDQAGKEVSVLYVCQMQHGNSGKEEITCAKQ